MEMNDRQLSRLEYLGFVVHCLHEVQFAINCRRGVRDASGPKVEPELINLRSLSCTFTTSAATLAQWMSHPGNAISYRR